MPCIVKFPAYGSHLDDRLCKYMVYLPDVSIGEGNIFFVTMQWLAIGVAAIDRLAQFSTLK